MENNKWKFKNHKWINQDTGTEYDNNGFDRFGFDKEGYDSLGFNLSGWNRDGINRYTLEKYDKNGFDVSGIYKTGKKYDEAGYDKDGFNSRGINKRHFYKDGTFQYNRNKQYDNAGYDMEGYNKYGWDENGFDRFGINCYGRDKNGNFIDYVSYSHDGRRNADIYWRHGLNYKTGKLLDIEGYDQKGYDKHGYDRKGYDVDGYDKDGYSRWSGYNKEGLNRNGLTREQQKEQDILDKEKQLEQKEEMKKQQRANYLGLKNKAEKLSKGEITLEEYVKCSKTSIDELIDFAKKEHMDADVIRGLYKYKKPYGVYKKSFSKKEYLSSTILMIEGKEVRPTEEDVDKCVAYLNAMGAWICDKTVKDTVRSYMRGELDITLNTEELKEQVEENKSTIAENKKEIKDTLVNLVLAQQSKIKSQEAEKTELKSQRREING